MNRDIRDRYRVMQARYTRERQRTAKFDTDIIAR